MFEQIQTKHSILLSVIIVSKNDYASLLNTFNSFNFSDDNKKNVEMILIDGGSTDETQSFIKTYSSQFSKIISEPDEGIYDAMNKGIDLASGEWTIFMNAGDAFANNEIVSNIITHLNYDIDVLFGDCILKYPGFNIIKKANKLEYLWKGMITTHQSIIIKTQLLKEHPFNVNCKIGADFEQIYSLFEQNKKFKYIPVVISAVDTSGISNRKQSQSLYDHYNTIRNQGNVNIRKHLYYWFIFIGLKIIHLFRLLFPQKLYYYFVKTFNRKNLV